MQIILRWVIEYILICLISDHLYDQQWFLNILLPFYSKSILGASRRNVHYIECWTIPFLMSPGGYLSCCLNWASSVLKFVFMKHDEVLCQSVTWICLSESGQDLLRTADWTISALLTIADQDRYSDQNFPNYLCTLIQVHQFRST